MKLKEAINKRHSTREFSNKEISDKIIGKIIEYAYKIPSAGNLKPIELFFGRFPEVYIIICADFKRTTDKYGERGIKYVYIEAGHTAQNICLISQEFGLGSCCVGAFDDEEVQKRCNLPFKPIYMIALGYPK